MAGYCVQSDKVLIYTKYGEYFAWLRNLPHHKRKSPYRNLRCQFINVAGKQYRIFIRIAKKMSALTCFRLPLNLKINYLKYLISRLIKCLVADILREVQS
jgi:hypothetical protein